MTAWPGALTPTALEWRIVRAGVQARSPFTGSLQAVDFIGDHWEITIGLRGEGRVLRRSRLLESVLMYLSGGVNVIDVFNWRNPEPAGTMRGTPTLAQVTVRGDSSLVINCGPSDTLLGGDLIGVGSQVFMVAPQGAVSAGATITVPLVNRVRGVNADDSPVVWYRPTVSVAMVEMSAGLIYQPGQALPSEITLVEKY